MALTDEERKKKRHEYYIQHKAEFALRSKIWYETHRAEWNAYIKEYRDAKKATMTEEELIERRARTNGNVRKWREQLTALQKQEINRKQYERVKKWRKNKNGTQQ